MSSQLWWYTARSAGIVAWALLTGSVLWGLFLSTRILGRRPRKAWLLDLHRFLGAAALVFIAIHLASLLLDSYVSFAVADLFVPLRTSWHPVAVAWGIVALYLLVTVELTSRVRDHLPRKVWKRIHYAAFPVWILTSVHALTAGSDATTRALRGAVILSSAAIAGLAAMRIDAANRRPAPAAAAARPTADSQATHR